MKKKCRKCGNIKNLLEFHKKKDTKDGHRHECKECVKDIQKKYKDKSGYKENRSKYDKKRYEENREKVLKRKKEYHIDNRKDILEKKRKYREENPDTIKKWNNENKDKKRIGQKRYREKHPHIIAWRSLLYSTLNRLNTNKSGHTIDVLGYSADELKLHLESMFLDGMTWDNHGEWHIDHTKPVTKFDKDTCVSIVCSLDNLQPLWAIDNLRKNNKY